MSQLSLNDIIKEQMQDEEFAHYYQREQLINAIAKLVVELRKANKLSQSELAKKAHTSQPVIARLESGCDSRMPSLELLARIAEATGHRINITIESRD